MNGRGHRTTKTLAKIIPELKERGFEFVTLTELAIANEFPADH
jgi:peptidoglycan/xylan/chitin deacetylase (PgdA/CDA1 family)